MTKQSWIVDYNLAIVMHKQGKSSSEIAQKFGVTSAAIRDALRRRGISFSTPRLDLIDTLSNDTDKAYLAGLLDGEGSINIVHQKKTKRFFLSVSVASTTKTLVDWLKTNIGGHIRISKRANSSHKTLYNWTVVSNQAKLLLENTYPYMKIKQEQVAIALQFQNRMSLPVLSREQETDFRMNLKRTLESLR